MQLFIIVLFKSDFMQPIFKKLADNGFMEAYYQHKVSKMLL